MDQLEADLLRVASIVSDGSDITIEAITQEGVVSLRVARDEPAHKTLKSKLSTSRLGKIHIEFGGEEIDSGLTFSDLGIEDGARVTFQKEAVDNPYDEAILVNDTPSLENLKLAADSCGMYDLTGDGIFTMDPQDVIKDRLPTMTYWEFGFKPGEEPTEDEIMGWKSLFWDGEDMESFYNGTLQPHSEAEVRSLLRGRYRPSISGVTYKCTRVMTADGDDYESWRNSDQSDEWGSSLIIILSSTNAPPKREAVVAVTTWLMLVGVIDTTDKDGNEAAALKSQLVAALSMCCLELKEQDF